MPLGEWTRRLGALPAEAYDCFMVGTLCGSNRIQAWLARLIAAYGRLPIGSWRTWRNCGDPNAGSLLSCSRRRSKRPSGRKNAHRAGRTKECNEKDRKMSLCSLDKESTIQAVCGNSASTDLCGGRSAMSVPCRDPTPTNGKRRKVSPLPFAHVVNETEANSRSPQHRSGSNRPWREMRFRANSGRTTDANYSLWSSSAPSSECSSGCTPQCV